MVGRRAALLVLTLIVSVFLVGTASAYAGSTTVGGTLRGPDGKPVAGVIITAAKGGQQVGMATTAKSGTWQISLPGAGDYTLTLDVSTLPGVTRHAEWARMGRETSGSAGMTGGACGVVVAGDRVGTTEWERPARLKFAA